MNNLKQHISQLNPEALTADGLDEAIVGYGGKCPSLPVVVYDYDKCVEIFMRDNEWDYDEAVEWMEFNVVNAYVGEGTPIFMKMAVNLCACPAAASDWDVTPYGEKR
jgi:hypothetical protein